MFGIPTFDLLSDRGKQEFIEYVVNLTRKEINSYTPSYSQTTQNVIGASANPYYGSFYDTTDQSIVAANTNQVVTINNTWGSNGVSIVDGSKITFEYPGTYTLNYLAHLSNLSNAVQDVSLWLRFNGVDYPHSSTEVNIQPRKSAGVPSSESVTISIVGTATSPNDYVELWWWATSTNVSLQFDPAHTSPTSPESPSVIVSVTPVSNIQTGERGPTGATGPTGPTGATGATGDTGAAATIAVGTVTTGAAGTSAIITNSGSSAAATFDFTIPRGDTGDVSTHAATHIPGGADVLDYSKIIGYGTALPTFSASLHPDGVLFAVNTVGEPYALYRSNGSAFLKVGGGGSITVADTAPSGVAGNLWYDSTTGKTYIYYDSFWVEVGNTGAVDITADTIIPAGMIMPTASSVEPSGWLYCYGQNLSRATYARLFTALGTVYGVGDGATTFGLPDLRGRMLAGKDNMGGSAANRITNTGTNNSGINAVTLGATGGDQRMHGHGHSITLPQATAGGAAANPGSYFSTNWTNTTPNSTSWSGFGGEAVTNGTGTAQNMPPTIIVNYLIKT
jgi:microcystin-dependent protein